MKCNPVLVFGLGCVTIAHVLLCPYTKVEESFNVQATHDFLFVAPSLSEFDHNEFPGVVPRSCLGAIFVSILAWPLKLFSTMLELPKFYVLLSVRCALGLSTLSSMYGLISSVAAIYGSSVANWLCALTISQFHFLFYASRPLPNTFALILFLLCITSILNGKYRMSVCFAVAAVVIFRAELLILFGFLYADLLFVSRKITILRGIMTGIAAGVICLCATVLVDSIFWGRWLWPEGEVLWYNTILNKSSDWGTSPFLWYFYSALPRALGLSVLFIPFGLWRETRFRCLPISCLLFVLVYSWLPHKELRFVVYVLPILNVWSAVACSILFRNRTKSTLNALLCVAAVGHVAANCMLSGIFLRASYENYPAGEAMVRIHDEAADIPNANMHIDVYCAQNGVSRFLHMRSDWSYNKSENLKVIEDYASFTFLCVGHPENVSESLGFFEGFRPVFFQEGYSGISVRAAFPPLTFKSSPKVVILEKVVVTEI